MDFCKTSSTINYRFDLSEGRSTMRYFITFVGLIFLGIGSVSAVSLDCGDDEARPINVHKAETKQ